MNLEGKKVKAISLSNKRVIGSVELVYNEAIASGESEYVNVTHLLVKDEDGNCHEVRPRQVELIID